MRQDVWNTSHPGAISPSLGKGELTQILSQNSCLSSWWITWPALAVLTLEPNWRQNSIQLAHFLLVGSGDVQTKPKPKASTEKSANQRHWFGPTVVYCVNSKCQAGLHQGHGQNVNRQRPISLTNMWEMLLLPGKHAHLAEETEAQPSCSKASRQQDEKEAMHFPRVFFSMCTAFPGSHPSSALPDSNGHNNRVEEGRSIQDRADHSSHLLNPFPSFTYQWMSIRMYEARSLPSSNSILEEWRDRETHL